MLGELEGLEVGSNHDMCGDGFDVGGIDGELLDGLVTVFVGVVDGLEAGSLDGTCTVGFRVVGTGGHTKGYEVGTLNAGAEGAPVGIPEGSSKITGAVGFVKT